jgi:hypothetical protein
MASEKNPLEEYLTEKRAAGPKGWALRDGRLKDFLTGAGEGLMGGHIDSHGKLTGGDMRSLGMNVGGKALGGAIGVGAGLIGAGVGVAAQKLYDAATKARDFRMMLEHNPDLEEMQQEKPKLFNQAYSTLRTFNPMFAKDPIVAGSYMRNMMTDPLHAGGVVEKSLDYRDKMRTPILSAFSRGGGKK